MERETLDRDAKRERDLDREIPFLRERERNLYIER